MRTTRLLDWTYSPYVALHFATAHQIDFDHDGAVWMVDFTETNKLLAKRLRRRLDEEGSLDGLASWPKRYFSPHADAARKDGV